ncbi:MAG: thioredoxin domain-containing protein [Chitinophagaceae bacterium]|nr:thioredoxin domain-containing protein [Oligoflexus sp.]
MSSGLLISVLVGGLGVGGAVGYVAGTGSAGKITSSATSSGGDTAWFTYDGKTYSTSSLPAQVQTNLYQAEMETYNQKIAVVREFAVRLALAQEQKKFTTIDKLPAVEELLPAAAVSDEQAKAFFDANKDKIPPGTTYEQLAPRIKELLGNEGRAKVFEDTWNKLTSEKKLTLLVKEPSAPVVTIPVATFPAKGASSDKNVLVEISDYLCPHCQEVQPDMKKLMDANKDIKFVQINFALRPDKLSGAIIEGAFCAQKQGNESFWKFHDTAFSKQWGTFADAYDVAKVKPIAEAAGLKIPDWEACMKSEEPKQFVNKTKDIVNGLGVTGTPTFYLNNKRLNIRRPDEMATVVNASLAK